MREIFIVVTCYRPKSMSTHQCGFTLIELMVTIAVLGVIVSMAAPNISQQIASQRVNNTTSILATALKQAKTESAIRRRNITMEVDSSDKTIKVKDGSNEISKYQLNSASSVKVAPAAQTEVTFTPNQRVDFEVTNAANTTNTVTYTLCDTNTNVTPKQITVNAIANISTQTAGSCP